MKIGIAGPISSESIAGFISGDAKALPRGYAGAPLLGTLIGALLERGHSVFAYTTSADLPLSTPVTATGTRFRITFCPMRERAFRFSQGTWGRAADAFTHERKALRQAMLADAPDLVHAHWSYEFALAAIDSGLPHVITCHDAPQVVLKYSPTLYRLVRYFMACRALSRAQCVTAVSPYLKHKLARFARVPIAVVPNPLPPNPSHLVEHSHRYDPAHPRIAMVLNGWGALKNPKPALRAFALLRRRYPAAELSIMGTDYGPGGKAQSWAQAYGLADGVRFMGPQPYPVLLAQLADADLLLHPSLEETFCMSIAEAMSLGIPVVGGRDSGAVPWVIGDGGLTTNVTSATSIETAMVRLLSDPATRLQYARAARMRVEENFTAAHVAASYESVYLTVLRGEEPRCEKRLVA